MAPDATNPAVGAAGSRENCSLLGGLNTPDTNKPNTRKKQVRSRAYRQYSIMRLLRDHGLAADCVSLSAGPPYSDITAQVLGRDFVVEAANTGDDFAWLKGRDVLVVKDKPAQLWPVSDAPGDALVILHLRVAAEIALAAEEVQLDLAHATALNLSCGLVRPERRRKSPARRAARP